MDRIRKVLHCAVVKRLALSSSHSLQCPAYSTLNHAQTTKEAHHLRGRRWVSEVSVNNNLSQSTTSDTEDSSSSSSSSSDDEEDHQNAEDIIRIKILDAALNYVNIYGWSSSSISKGAEDVGYSSMAHGMFADGTDLVNYFYKKCNEELEEHLRALVVKNNEENVKVSTKQFIRDALEVRLRMNEIYLDSWAQALAIHFNPKNASQALENLGTVVDHIWYYAGDRSFDFNWYTKRASLAAMYKFGELSMLQDKSPGLQDTFSSLDRRMNDLQSISNIIKEVGIRSEDVKNLGKATVITALNILGLNSKSR